MRYKVKRGLDIPILGAPTGEIQSLANPKQISLNLDPFDWIRFKVLIKVGEKVKIGTPLVYNKAIEGQNFVSPAAGVVKEVRRGLKRRLLDIVIDVDAQEEYEEFGKPASDSNKDLIAHLLKGGIFPHIRQRPFNWVANPNHTPRDIFVRAMETAPFVPPASMQLRGREKLFQTGLDTLSKLTTGSVHLVHNEPEFASFTGVKHHTFTGPHPASSSSLHIQKIAPIRTPTDYVWTLSTLDVIAVGKMIAEGCYATQQVISVAGPAIVEGRAGYFAARRGFPIEALLQNHLKTDTSRLISGDPLAGTAAQAHDFLGFYHTCFCAIPENHGRQPFHFFRLGLNKFSATHAYLTPHKKFAFSTNQHGEERAFIDGAIYHKVMPLRIPTMHLIKAVLAQDFDLAQQLGFLEVAPEDFALPTFICPSKIEMIPIIKQGIHLYAQELGNL